MATNWVIDPDRRKYLLANGQVVENPPMERTTSTRPRFRFLGEADSYGSNQIKDELILRVENRHGSKIIQSYQDPALIQDQLAQHLGHSTWQEVTADRADLGQLAPRGANRNAGTHVRGWVRFRHDTLPLDAVAVTTAQWYYGKLNVTTETFVRSTHVVNRDEVGILTYRSGQWTDPPDLDYNKMPVYQIRQAVEAADPPWPTAGKNDVHPSIQRGVRAFGTIVRELNSLSEIKVPYWSDTAATGPSGYLTLRPVETNINSEFLSQLTEYVSNRETLAKVARAHQALVQALREAGIVVDHDPSEDQLIAMLTSGTHLAQIECQADEIGGIVDRNHHVRMNLLTGTVVVNCTTARGSQNQQAMSEAAQAWEVARFQADIGGVEDELLAYARESVRRQGQERAIAIEEEHAKELTS